MSKTITERIAQIQGVVVISTGEYLLSMDETARRCGMALSTLWEYQAAGALPTLKVGRRRLVEVARIPEFIEHLRERSK
jgi:predicted DNA-binding transcriptional regulator AlpA